MNMKDEAGEGGKEIRERDGSKYEKWAGDRMKVSMRMMRLTKGFEFWRFSMAPYIYTHMEQL